MQIGEDYYLCIELSFIRIQPRNLVFGLGIDIIWSDRLVDIIYFIQQL